MYRENKELNRLFRLLEMTQRQIDNYNRRKEESNEWFFSDHYIDIFSIKNKHVAIHLKITEFYKKSWGV